MPQALQIPCIQEALQTEDTGVVVCVRLVAGVFGLTEPEDAGTVGVGV